MDQIVATESLLPWLAPESSRIYLQVSAPVKASAVAAGPPDFPLLDASSPLARLVRAAFTAGSQQTVSEVFLLLQKDHYTFAEAQPPFGNRDVDAMWREAWAAAALTDGAAGLLSPPGGDAAMPLWRSLFYCAHRQRFFHPPCPGCGRLLELCTWDEALLTAGLPAYSASLQRFLFCPACHAGGGAEFFAFAAAESAAPPVRNRWALIHAYARLAASDEGATAFPCPHCPQRGECYGAAGQVAARIIPFAFYPFRMIVTPARQLHAADFLSLAAGAPRAEVAARLEAAGLAGRAACVNAQASRETGGISLFFQDARRFLELLYLKLALLAQVSGASFAALRQLPHAELRLGIDQFWVDFADYAGPLPHFWNFQAAPLAIGLASPQDSPFLKVPESLGLRSLALLWFHVLLANSRLTGRDIIQALAVFLERHQAEEQPDFLALADDGAVFGPGNIFWQPAASPFPAAWLELWRQALGLGWSLLRQSCQPAPAFPAAAFTARLAGLAGEVRQSLFAVEAVPVAAMPVADGDAAIRRILLDIRRRWLAEPPAAPAVAGAGEEAGAGEQVTAPPAAAELEKTVLMSADQLAALMRKEARPGSVSQGGGAVAAEPPTVRPGGAVPDEDAGLAKTVIMGPDALASFLAGRNGQAAAEPAAPRAAPPKPPLPDAAAAGLSETVMITPQQLAALRKMKKDDK